MCVRMKDLLQSGNSMRNLPCSGNASSEDELDDWESPGTGGSGSCVILEGFVELIWDSFSALFVFVDVVCEAIFSFLLAVV